MRGHWSLYSEVESRQGNAQLGTQRLGRVEFRLHVAPYFSLTTGYVLAANGFGRVDTFTAPEHHFYQEVTLADQSGPVRASHRLRVEERWLRPTPEAAFRFAPRLRYQLRLMVPLRTSGRLPVGRTYGVVADELFAGLGPCSGACLLEENRASAGLGYRLSPRTSLEMAYPAPEPSRRCGRHGIEPQCRAGERGRSHSQPPGPGAAVGQRSAS